MPGFELIDEQEKAAVVDIFDNQGGVLFAHGFDALRKGHYQVREFEQACANKFGVEYALAVTSGTSALAIALKALGIEPGDQVITQAFTFVASVEAILSIGAEPILVNIDDTLNMDPIELEQIIGDRTKAIMPVHMLGMAANMNAISSIANKYGLKIVEDNCESIGASLDGKYLGTIGDVGVISFDHGKALTTGEGGMLLTNSKVIYDYAREYHDHGHQNNPKLPRGRDSKRFPGFNYRMTEIQAAIGKVQLGKLSFLLEENAKRYDILHDILSVVLEPRKVVANCIGQKDCYIFKVDNSLQRQKILDLLNENGVGTKNIPDAIEWHCAFYWDHILESSDIARLEKSKSLLEDHIAIPIMIGRNEDQYRNIANEIARICKSNL